MNHLRRSNRRVLRAAIGYPGIIIPGPACIWLLYLLVIAALIKYLVS